jgi:hypothetical protein
MAQSTTNLGKIHVFPSETLYNQFKNLVADNDLALLKDDGAYIIAANLAQNGYVKFSNGLILQWGFSDVPNSSTVVTFPISFAARTFIVLPILQTTDGGNMSKNRLYVTNLTVKGFSIYNPQDSYNWLAIGR